MTSAYSRPPPSLELKQLFIHVIHCSHAKNPKHSTGELVLSPPLNTFVKKKKSGRIGSFSNLVKGNNFLSIGQAMWF